jgi:hypothetical protein
LTSTFAGRCARGFPRPGFSARSQPPKTAVRCPELNRRDDRHRPHCKQAEGKLAGLELLSSNEWEAGTLFREPNAARHSQTSVRTRRTRSSRAILSTKSGGYSAWQSARASLAKAPWSRPMRRFAQSQRGITICFHAELVDFYPNRASFRNPAAEHNRSRERRLPDQCVNSILHGGRHRSHPPAGGFRRPASDARGRAASGGWCIMTTAIRQMHLWTPRPPMRRCRLCVRSGHSRRKKSCPLIPKTDMCGATRDVR